MTNKLKETKPNMPCYGRHKKNNPADRKYADSQEVTYSGRVRFSGTIDDLAMGFLES